MFPYFPMILPCFDDFPSYNPRFINVFQAATVDNQRVSTKCWKVETPQTYGTSHWGAHWSCLVLNQQWGNGHQFMAISMQEILMDYCMLKVPYAKTNPNEKNRMIHSGWWWLNKAVTVDDNGSMDKLVSLVSKLLLLLIIIIISMSISISISINNIIIIIISSSSSGSSTITITINSRPA